jgi:hypothetical protein
VVVEKGRREEEEGPRKERRWKVTFVEGGVGVELWEACGNRCFHGGRNLLHLPSLVTVVLCASISFSPSFLYCYSIIIGANRQLPVAVVDTIHIGMTERERAAPFVCLTLEVCRLRGERGLFFVFSFWHYLLVPSSKRKGLVGLVGNHELQGRGVKKGFVGKSRPDSPTRAYVLQRLHSADVGPKLLSLVRKWLLSTPPKRNATPLSLWHLSGCALFAFTEHYSVLFILMLPCLV